VADRFSALLEVHGGALGRLAATYAWNRADREDLYQEIVTAIWLALPRFRGDCSERTFIFRIAHNRGLAYLAKRRLPVTSSAEEIEDGFADRGPDPEQALAIEQQGQRLLDAIQQLPLAYRQVVTLTLEGLSYGEVAEVLGISEGNVGARLTRARQMLRKRIGDAHATRP
jgi:RNA polymerase sigma-70 factor (ECF subfamily)